MLQMDVSEANEDLRPVRASRGLVDYSPPLQRPGSANNKRNKAGVNASTVPKTCKASIPGSGLPKEAEKILSALQQTKRPCKRSRGRGVRKRKKWGNAPKNTQWPAVMQRMLKRVIMQTKELARDVLRLRRDWKILIEKFPAKHPDSGKALLCRVAVNILLEAKVGPKSRRLPLAEAFKEAARISPIPTTAYEVKKYLYLFWHNGSASFYINRYFFHLKHKKTFFFFSYHMHPKSISGNNLALG